MVQLLVFLFSFQLIAQVDRVYRESYLGEKRLESYHERYSPLIYQDIYRGKIHFQDDIFFQNFFIPYLFDKERDFSMFLRSELNGGITCSNSYMAEHFDDIRYAYRLITLSYLIESQWHLSLISKHLKLKQGCSFNQDAWIRSCSSNSLEMKKFVSRFKKYQPKSSETFSRNYKMKDWFTQLKSQDFKHYSHYRLNEECLGSCSEGVLSEKFSKVCEDDQKLMTLICSEQDSIYGLSQNRDAYYLLGQSNIINTFNKRGEAAGCLRRFSEMMSHKEVRYEVLKTLFPALQTYLKQNYQERFLQGRTFFYGAGKEFDEKGLTDIYVIDQPLKIEKIPEEPKITINDTVVSKAPSVIANPPPMVIEPKPIKTIPKEFRKPIKSAFLQAAELRSSSNLNRADVDMLKLKYDYVFSLNMINTLSQRLKTFMTREALVEMMNYDKLGTKEGPVPLLFLKFMIDMQEHHGLWNIISVLGNRFYVSNEIDTGFKTEPELVELVNNESTGGQWLIYILKP